MPLSLQTIGSICSSLPTTYPSRPNIPAYRAMRGTVIEVAPIGRGLKVRWDDDREAGCGPDTMWRGAWTVALAEEGS